jgi:mannitol/fructose-specific phosphotransferase system IIA component (Ntr-type)
VRLASLIVPESSLLNISVQQKDEVTRLLIERLSQARGVDVPLALKDMATRERKGSTVLRAGRHRVAVAHAVTAACKQLLVAIGTVPTGINKDSVDVLRADVVFVLLGPAPTYGLYLKVLSRISRLCETEDLIGADRTDLSGGSIAWRDDRG